MKISIVIVSWNVKNLLKRCLESIFVYSKNIELEIIVVDNASQDGTADMVKKEFTKVRLIENNKNLGFAKANNQAIRKSRGEYILLLNPDTKFIEDTLSKIIKKMDSNDKIGVLGCRLLNENHTLQRSVRAFPRKRDILIIFLKLYKIFPQLLYKYFARNFDYSREREVDQIMGAFFLVRSEVFEKIGYLDEKYFIWFEEVDFCYRVWHSGWKVVYTPASSIVHYGGQSFNQANTWKKQLWFFHSALRFFSKKRGQNDTK